MSSAAYLLSIRGQLHESLVLEARVLAGDPYSRYAEIQVARVLEFIGHPAAEDWRSRAELSNPNQVVVLAEAVESLLRQGTPNATLD